MRDIIYRSPAGSIEHLPARRDRWDVASAIDSRPAHYWKTGKLKWKKQDVNNFTVGVANLFPHAFWTGGHTWTIKTKYISLIILKVAPRNVTHSSPEMLSVLRSYSLAFCVYFNTGRCPIPDDVGRRINKCTSDPSDHKELGSWGSCENGMTIIWWTRCQTIRSSK